VAGDRFAKTPTRKRRDPLVMAKRRSDFDLQAGVSLVGSMHRRRDIPLSMPRGKQQHRHDLDSLRPACHQPIEGFCNGGFDQFQITSLNRSRPQRLGNLLRHRPKLRLPRRIAGSVTHEQNADTC
jgi:hypothetical protein